MMRAIVRWGYVAANKIDIGPPSKIPNSGTRDEPSTSLTAKTSSIRCSSVKMAEVRSERPVPRLSNKMRRENEASRSRHRAADRILPDVVDVRYEAGHEDEVEGTLTHHLVGDVNVATLYVPSLGSIHLGG